MKVRRENPGDGSVIIAIGVLVFTVYYVYAKGGFGPTGAGSTPPGGSGGGLIGGGTRPGAAPSYAFVPGIQFVAAVPGGFQVVTKGQVKGFYTDQTAAQNAYNSLIQSGG